MKYIRTKDKILIAPELYDNGGMVLCSDPPMYETRNAKNEWGCVDISEVIKIADTIEELCDELVFEWHRSSISHDNDVWHLYHEISLKEEVENALTDGYRADIEQVKNIYGAIWTEKGLIYVAKMNEKGELELL